MTNEKKYSKIMYTYLQMHIEANCKQIEIVNEFA